MAAKLHEIVIPPNPLPVWYYIFHDLNGEQYVAPHWHCGIELSYVVHGKIRDFRINQEHFSSKPGKILLVNTQEIHSIRNYAYENDLALSIIFPYDYVSKFYPDICHQLISINKTEDFTDVQKMVYSELQGLLTEFIKLYFVKSKFKYLRQQEIIDRVLLLLLSNFTKERPAENQLGQRKVYVINRLQYITQYINNHYKEELNLDDIAKNCNISKEYLARFFKKQMEITVDTYINNVRSQHAHQDLLNSNKTLTKIAANNGFSGVRTMNRAFKKFYGKSASEYRQNLYKK